MFAWPEPGCQRPIIPRRRHAFTIGRTTPILHPCFNSQLRPPIARSVWDSSGHLHNDMFQCVLPRDCSTPVLPARQNEQLNEVRLLNEAWQKREFWVFLCLIAVVNSIFIGSIAAGVRPERVQNVVCILLQGLALATVVFAFRRLEGLRELVRSLGVLRVDPRWYLLTLTAKNLWSGANAFEISTSLIAAFSLLVVFGTRPLFRRPGASVGAGST